MENSYEILLILHEKSLTFLQNNRQFRKRVFLARNKGSSLTPSLINLREPMINSEEKKPLSLHKKSCNRHREP